MTDERALLDHDDADGQPTLIVGIAMLTNTAISGIHRGDVRVHTRVSGP